MRDWAMLDQSIISAAAPQLTQGYSSRAKTAPSRSRLKTVAELFVPVLDDVDRGRFCFLARRRIH